MKAGRKPKARRPVVKARKQPKARRPQRRTVHLPKTEVVELQEEISATGRSLDAIITEALRIRRGALEAIGIEIETTMATELSRLIESHCRAGAKVLARIK